MENTPLLLVLEKFAKNKPDKQWVGFCSYRELWGEHKNIENKNSIDSVIKYLPSEWNNYDAIVGEPDVY